MNKINIPETAKQRLLQHFEHLYPGKTTDIRRIAITLEWVNSEISPYLFHKKTTKTGLVIQKIQKLPDSKHPLSLSTARLSSNNPRPIFSTRIVPFLYKNQSEQFIVLYTIIRECSSNYIWAKPITRKIKLYAKCTTCPEIPPQTGNLIKKSIHQCINTINLPPGAIYFPQIEDECTNPIESWTGEFKPYSKQDTSKTKSIQKQAVIQKIQDEAILEIITITKNSHNYTYQYLSIPDKKIDLCCMPKQTWEHDIVDLSDKIRSPYELKTLINKICDTHNFTSWHNDNPELANPGNFPPAIYLAYSWCKHKNLLPYIPLLRHELKIEENSKNETISNTRRAKKQEEIIRQIENLLTAGKHAREKHVGELIKLAHILTHKTREPSKKRTHRFTDDKQDDSNHR